MFTTKHTDRNESECCTTHDGISKVTAERITGVWQTAFSLTQGINEVVWIWIRYILGPVFEFGNRCILQICAHAFAAILIFLLRARLWLGLKTYHSTLAQLWISMIPAISSSSPLKVTSLPSRTNFTLPLEKRHGLCSATMERVGPLFLKTREEEWTNKPWCVWYKVTGSL